MLGTDLRSFLRHPIQTVAAIASDPFEALIAFQERIVARREGRIVPDSLYQAEVDWERRLHQWLGVPWPCKMNS
jgi:hypothetical protein